MSNVRVERARISDSESDLHDLEAEGRRSNMSRDRSRQHHHAHFGANTPPPKMDKRLTAIQVGYVTFRCYVQNLLGI